MLYHHRGQLDLFKQTHNQTKPAMLNTIERLERIVLLKTAQRLLDCPKTPDRIRAQQQAIVDSYRGRA